ncbi:mechanosensitive ion channel family protein [Labrys neptuniae]
MRNICRPYWASQAVADRRGNESMATTRVPLWVMSPLFICLMVALFSSAPVARAQSAAVGNSPSSSAASTPSDASSQLAALPQPLTRAAIRDMVSRMSDDDVRRFLLQRLDAQAETAETPSQPSEPNDPTQQDPITTVASAIDRDVVSTFQSIPYLSGALADAWNGFLRGYGTDNHGHGYILVRQKAGWLGALDFAWKSLAILLVALVSMIGVPRLLKRFVAARIPAAPASASADRLRLIERFGTEASGILVFAVASLMLALAVFGLPDWASAEAWSARNGIVFPSPAGRSAITHVGNGEYFTFTHLLAAIVAGLCARLFGHLVFSPADASLRLVNCDDAAAAFLTRQTVLIVILALPTAILLPILSVWGLSESWQAQGMAGAVGPKFGFWFTGALIIACIYTMLKPYRAWTQIMLGFDSPGPVVRSLARIWPLVASGLFLLLMLYLRFVIAVYGPRYVNDFAEYVTIVLIFSLPVFDTGMRALIDHFTLIRADNLSGRQVKANEVVRTGLLRLGRIFVLVGLVLVLAAAWEIPLFASATAQGWLGPQIVAIFLALLIAYAAWALLGIFARRQVELDEGAGMALSAGGDGASSDQAMSRLGTVMPIIQRAGQGLILVTTLFVIMTELKINATPLIAAASVVGLAVGFGAQTLVKDIVSGVFYLAEDTFRVGEYIDVGGT